jgi:hypothetical protein
MEPVVSDLDSAATDRVEHLGAVCLQVDQRAGSANRCYVG